MCASLRWRLCLALSREQSPRLLPRPSPIQLGCTHCARRGPFYHFGLLPAGPGSAVQFAWKSKPPASFTSLGRSVATAIVPKLSAVAASRHSSRNAWRAAVSACSPCAARLADAMCLWPNGSSLLGRRPRPPLPRMRVMPWLSVVTAATTPKRSCRMLGSTTTLRVPSAYSSTAAVIQTQSRPHGQHSMRAAWMQTVSWNR
mmetsp:Transcript_69888/g.138325  ORF Transcript_69888/g.138325 Transcript_69888/m.138325 type:complete len:201 (+) Transcript_69888:168-770(+)